jgi:hypothetical protein
VDPDDEGYEAYLAYIYDTYIGGRVHEFHLRDYGEWAWEFDAARMAHADLILRSIAAGLEPYDNYRLERLSQMLRDVAGGLEANSNVLERTGFAEVIDSDFEIIARGMRPEHLPPEEAEALRTLGFSHTADHLPGLLYVVRHRAEVNPLRETPPSRALERTAEAIADAAEDHDRLAEIEQRLAAMEQADDSEITPNRARERLEQETSQKRKPRRWFKAVGQIVQGTAMSLADIALAAGVLRFKVPEETRTWGALVSVTVGVGTIINGAGDLRGE